jgi:hypothetical protein
MSRPYRYLPCHKGSKHYVGFSDNPGTIPERAECPFCGKNVSVRLIFPVPGKIGRYGGQLGPHNTDQRVYL